MLNKTLKENEKKTKSAPKLVGVVVIALVVALMLSFLASFSFRDTSSTGDSCLTGTSRCYSLERVDTDATRMQGLSGRDGLKPMTGMLFVFDAPAEQCFWMKDMRFSIDIIWLDSDNTINRIEKNLSPSTYPQQFCKSDTKSVLELAAGEADTLQLQLGQQLTL